MHRHVIVAARESNYVSGVLHQLLVSWKRRGGPAYGDYDLHFCDAPLAAACPAPPSSFCWTMVLHGDKDGLIARGTPDSGDVEYVAEPWFDCGRWPPLLFLFGCKTLLAAGSYSCLRRRAEVIGYADDVIFWAQTSNGKARVRRFFDGLVNVLANDCRSAAGFHSRVRDLYAETLEALASRREAWFVTDEERSEIRAQLLLFKIQLDGVLLARER